MTAHAAEFFTLDEVNRLKIIQDVIDRRLTTQMAAQRLGISDRQCRRLLSRYRESGPLGMTNRRRGKPSNNQLPDGLAQYALNIVRERYTDFGPTLACEKLAELHDVHLSKETVRSLMVKAGVWIPRKQRAPKIQQPRYRRACCGELIQIDGYDHHWFEFADEFMADYNRRFAKAPRHGFNVAAGRACRPVLFTTRIFSRIIFTSNSTC